MNKVETVGGLPVVQSNPRQIDRNFRIAGLSSSFYDLTMTPARMYTNAPIKEAIIDLRVKLCPDFDTAILESVRAGNEFCYPKSEPIQQTELTVSLTPPKVPATSHSQMMWGFKFTSDNGKRIWQSRRDGFSLSQLAPYTNWCDFRDEARQLWTKYRHKSSPEAIERLAVRYINRIDVPMASIELKHYLRTSPEISADLPQELSAYFMQLRLPQTDLGGAVVINQTIIPPPQPEMVSIVLDIDLFSDQDVPQSDEEIWSFFERLHLRKNEVFEACITDQTRSLFTPC